MACSNLLPCLSRRPLILAALAAWCVRPAGAAETGLRVMLNEVQPYAWSDAAGLHGLHHAIMQAVGQEAGLALSYRLGLYARLGRALTDHSADLAVTLMGPDQDAQGVRVEALHAVRYLVLSRADAPVRALTDLHGRRLGLARSAYYGAEINDNERIERVSVIDPFQGLRMLALGRLDAVISSDLLLAQALHQPQLPPTRFAPVLDVGGSAYALYASRQLPPGPVEQLRAAIQRLGRRGQIAALVKPYQWVEG